jgi:hypothetical protein
VLAGQPELAARLRETQLRQLKQRVSLRCEIKALDLPEAAAYIAARIRAAGGEPIKLFTREAIIRIHQRSRGIPRTISVMCDNALLSGFALGVQPITQEIVMEVCRDFDFSDSAPQSLLGNSAEPADSDASATSRPRLANPAESSLAVHPETRNNPDDSNDERVGRWRRRSFFGR